MIDTDMIFLLGPDDHLERVPHAKYASEELLQALLEEHPELLVGDQINPDNPPRWLLVSREAGIPDAEGASDRWSVDHLLLDQHGRPTFVEVKRSSDTRIRREVVGQMLDYAANALVYWPQDRIRMLAATGAGGPEQLETRMVEFLELDEATDNTPDIEAYWRTVERNLREGELRLLFVADEIPTELRRIIEFLNERMQTIEVLGVEIRQYEGQNIRALVPRVIGQTEYARQQKSGAAPRGEKITEADFLAECPEPARAFFKTLLSESAKRGFTVTWGTKGFSVRVPTPQGKLVSYLYGYPAGVDDYPVPLFQTYLGYIDDPDTKAIAQEAFTRLIPFHLRGKHTLQVELDEDGVRAATGGLLDALELAGRLASGEQP